MKKLIFCVVMVLMTVITFNVYAQPENLAPFQTASSEKPVIKNKAPQRFMFLELDSVDLRDMRIDSLRKLIYKTLDSLSETKNVFVSNNETFYKIYGGEFRVRELTKGHAEFLGNCGFDIFWFSLRDVLFDRLGRKFRIKFGTVFYGDKDVDISVVEPRFLEFLKRIRTPLSN